VSAIHVDHLVADYGGQAVLVDTSLHVEEGSLACVLGPSGCGKTTLLRVIAGFEPAQSGTVRIGDRVVDDGRQRLAAERRRVGYVPQEGAMFPHLSVADNIGFALSRRGSAARADRAARIAELLSLIGMDDLGERYPHELSGGQQQRVAVARALASDPEVVLLDEPFAALDAALRARLRAEIRGVLRAAGVTAVLVTHDRSEALSLADQVAVMRDGRIVQADVPRSLYLRPVDEGVARFAGDATVLDVQVAAGAATSAVGVLPVADGSPVTSGPGRAVIRPEQVAVAAPAQDPGARPPNGRVRAVEYYGHDARVDVDLLIGERPSTLRIVARVPGVDAPAEGDLVTVSVGSPVWVLGSASEDGGATVVGRAAGEGLAERGGATG
jgi:iron(III) transport system ATP-binding protein